MIESMVTAIVENIRDEIAGKEPTHAATWNATGSTEPVYEKYVLKALRILRPKSGEHREDAA